MSQNRTKYQTLLDNWAVGTIQTLEIPATGTINDIRIVTTDRGKYVLRGYQRRNPIRIQQEHRLVSWIHRQNIPAVKPLKMPKGDTFVEHQNQLFSLLPFVSGRQISRATIQPEEIKAMGQMLGLMHQELAEYPTTDISQSTFKIDRQETLSSLDRLIHHIQKIKAPQPTDEYALKRLITRRTWLEKRGHDTVDRIYELPFQATHGDYQETNVIFQNNEIAAIIDWDKVQSAPATWEILRALYLMFGLKPSPCKIFLQAYQEYRKLSLQQLDLTAHCFGLSQAYSMWLYEDLYDKGNDRLRQFVRPGEFVPIEKIWADLRPILREHLP